MVNLDKLYSVKLEHHLIAGLINNPDVFPEIDPFLNEEHFGNDTNKSLYRVVKDIILSGKETDAVIIAQKVKDSCRRHNISTKDDIDIFDYVDSLANIKISAKGVKETVDELIRKKVQRDFYFTANNILEYIGKSGGDSSDEIIRNTEKIFGDKVSHYNFTETPKHILEEAVSEIENRMKNPVEETGLKTPYPEFNRLYGGLRTGNLYCFCSRPKAGKTTCLNDLALKVPIINNCKALVLDTEMSGEEMMFRLASSISGVPVWYLETGNVSKYPKYRKLWEENRDKIKQYEKLYTHFSVPGKKVEEIESIIRRWYYREVGLGNVGVVIYDYIKLTGEKDYNKQEYQLIGDKVSKLKDLSAKLNIPILTACQLNRSAEEKRDDNGAIAQSDRLSWFASGIWIFRRKWQEEIQEEGEDFGTHKLIEVVTRFQGKDAKGHNTLIRVLDHMDHNNKPKYKYLNNYINFKVENFRVEEKGSLETILKRKQEKYEIQKKETRDDIL